MFKLLAKKNSLFIFCFRLFSIALIALVISCSPTKTLTQDEYLLNSNRIKTKLHSLDRDEINAIIKQKPNKKLFGFFRFYLHAYNYAKSKNVIVKKDTSRFKKWVLNTIAEEPVLLDTVLTKKTVKQLQLFLQKLGYFNAVVTDTIIYHNKKANIIYTLIGNKPYLFNNIEYQIYNTQLRQLIFSDTSSSLLKKGRLFDQNKIEQERERITRLIRNNGYYNFQNDYVKFLADTALRNNTVNTKIVINNRLDNADTTHYQYYIGKVIIYPEFKVEQRNATYENTATTPEGYTFIFNKKMKLKRDVLTKPIFFEPTKLYSQSDVEETYKRYQNLKVFSNVNLSFEESSDSILKKIDAYVRLSPVRKQSYSLEVEGTHSSGNYGIRGNVVYQNKNVFRGAEIFQIKTSLELKQLDVINKTGTQSTGEKIQNATFNTIEIGPEISLNIPRFAFPFISPYFSKKAYPKTVFTAAYNYQKNNGYQRNISNVSFAYNWREGKYKQHLITPIDFNYIGITKTPEFEEILQKLKVNSPLILQSYKPLLITAIKYSFTYNTQENFKKKFTTYLKVNVETAGNMPTLVNKWRGAERTTDADGALGPYTIFKGIDRLTELEQPYAQYAKLEVDYRKYISFTGNKDLVLRFNGGYAIAYENSKALPFVKSFFGGGTNDIRAWRARGLGPGNYTNPTANTIEKIGDIKLVGNFEYRYKVYKKLNAATFIDIGNIWLRDSDKITGKPNAHFNLTNFYNGIAVGGGFGLRYDFTFFIFRLDIAAKFRNPAAEAGHRWIIFEPKYLSGGNFNFLNIGIGYPF